jgi:hypothetical protein
MQLAAVLRGANPSEVEQPTRFEMMITLKTALDIDIRPGCSPAPTRCLLPGNSRHSVANFGT